MYILINLEITIAFYLMTIFVYTSFFITGKSLFIFVSLLSVAKLPDFFPLL